MTKIDMHAFMNNAKLWTTPFDVHETLLDLTHSAKIQATTSHVGVGCR